MTAAELAGLIGPVLRAEDAAGQIAACQALGHVEPGRWVVLTGDEPTDVARITLEEAGLEVVVLPGIGHARVLVDRRRAEAAPRALSGEIGPVTVSYDEIDALIAGAPASTTRPVAATHYSRGYRLSVLNETYRRASIRQADVEERCDLIDDVLDSLEQLPEVELEP